MIYLIAITLLALSHLIAYMGKNGCSFPKYIEKITVLLACVLSFSAILELGSFISAFIGYQENALFEFLFNIAMWSSGFVLFLFIIFVGLPKPIEENQKA